MYKSKKLVKKKQPISILILATMPDYGMKSLGNKSLIHVKNLPLIEHQLIHLKKSMRAREYEIIYLCGYEQQKTQKKIEKYSETYNVKFISQNIDNLNYGGALVDGIQHIKYNNVLYINYANLFKQTLSSYIKTNKDYIFVSPNHHNNSHIRIGFQENNRDQDNYLFFDIGSKKYLDCGILTKHTIQIIKDMDPDKYSNKFLFEIINLLPQFDSIEINPKDCLFVDSNKTLNKSRRFLTNVTKHTKTKPK